MRKQELDELRRLEEELMADEYMEEEPLDELDLLDDTWQEFMEVPISVYNTDDTDVDLESYSEEVQQAQDRRPSSGLLTVLILFLLLVVIFCLLKILGVL